jgi:hypothetical protein
MRSRAALFLAASFGILGLSGCGGLTSGLLGGLPTPVLTNISPNPVTHSTSVTITGANLNGTLTTATYAPTGGGSTTQFAATSGSTTSVIVPVPAATGTYNVFVTISDGAGSTSTASNVLPLTVN